MSNPVKSVKPVRESIKDVGRVELTDAEKKALVLKHMAGTLTAAVDLKMQQDAALTRADAINAVFDTVTPAYLATLAEAGITLADLRLQVK